MKSTKFIFLLILSVLILAYPIYGCADIVETYHIIGVLNETEKFKFEKNLKSPIITFNKIDNPNLEFYVDTEKLIPVESSNNTIVFNLDSYLYKIITVKVYNNSHEIYSGQWTILDGYYEENDNLSVLEFKHVVIVSWIMTLILGIFLALKKVKPKFLIWSIVISILLLIINTFKGLFMQAC